MKIGEMLRRVNVSGIKFTGKFESTLVFCVRRWDITNPIVEESGGAASKTLAEVQFNFIAERSFQKED